MKFFNSPRSTQASSVQATLPGQISSFQPFYLTMPALTTTDCTILVTGANGFLGTWIIALLLARGYSVRAAVRSPAKGQNLLDLYSSYGSKLRLCMVDDIAQDGAFDDAVKAVEGIIHIASPVHLSADDPNEMIIPAVNGVTGLLKSALKHGTSLQRMIFTSSSAAIRHYSALPITLSEADWNDECEARVSSLGRTAEPQDKYSVSKIMAEKALWEFSEEHKGDLNWDITALNPPCIFGPVTAEPISAAGPNPPQATSSRNWFDAVVNGDFMGLSPLEAPGHAWVNVRNIAEAHIRALEKPEAGGKRIVVACGSFVWQDFLDAANSLTPSPWLSHTSVRPLAVGQPGEPVHRRIMFDTRRCAEVLGLKYRSMSETTRDILADYETRGW